MKRNMKEWLDALRESPVKKAMPVLSFPAVQLMGISVRELISDSEAQAKGMALVAERTDAAAAVSLMDLSLEAECFGSTIRVSDDEVPTVVGSIVASESDLEKMRRPVVGDGRTGVFTTKGNKFGHVVLRGGQHMPNYGSENVAFAVELMRKLKLTPSIIIDCSHANSMRNPLNQPKILDDVVEQIRNGQMAISGVMLESYIKTGRQDITAKGKIIPGVSLTDPCLGWAETEAAILNAYENLP